MPPDIRKPLRKYLPHLMQAQAEGLNEADTVHRLARVFEDVFGYNPMGEITRESAVKDKFVDLALKIDGSVRLLVEVKSGGPRYATSTSSRRRTTWRTATFDGWC